MKIGVFGDSFAEKTLNVCSISEKSWWRRLQLDHGHQVFSHGTGGSSLMYSAQLLKKHHREFDFNIWCVTTPGRFSITIPDSTDVFHSTHYMDANGNFINKPDVKYNHLVNVCRDYLKYIFDWEDETLIGRSVISYLINSIDNLMIIPCFDTPIENNFNLFALSELEINSAFSNKSYLALQKKYEDHRPCHLTYTNNKILADTIADNLAPGIFSISYDIFNFEILPQDIFNI